MTIENQMETIFSAIDKFQFQTFIVIIYEIITVLKDRASVYQTVTILSKSSLIPATWMKVRYDS